MIKTFADKETQQLFITGKSKRMPSDLLRRAIRRLEYIHYATSLNDLRVPPSNRLHALKGERKGQHSISINEQWRICFRFIDGDAYDVEKQITTEEMKNGYIKDNQKGNSTNAPGRNAQGRFHA
jgi:proteic killer suppression protein